MTLRIQVGDVIGRITVLGVAPSDSANRKRFFVACACGEERIIPECSLQKPAKDKSCGCARKKHGGHLHPEYNVWQGMWRRCTNPSANNYYRYGAIGIGVCARWKDFSAFVSDMGPRPRGTSLDRIDNSAGYSPENCRWATAQEQGLNTRVNRIVEFHGEKRPLAAWCKELGLNYPRIHARISKLHWSVERAFSS